MRNNLKHGDAEKSQKLHMLGWSMLWYICTEITKIFRVNDYISIIWILFTISEFINRSKYFDNSIFWSMLSLRLRPTMRRCDWTLRRRFGGQENSRIIEVIVTRPILIRSSRSDVAVSRSGFVQSGPLCPFVRVFFLSHFLLLSLFLFPSLFLSLSLFLSGNLVRERRSAPGAASTVTTCVSLCRDSTRKYDESNFQQTPTLYRDT